MNVLRMLVVALLGAGAACGGDSTQDLRAADEGQAASSAVPSTTASSVAPPPEASAPSADVSLWLSADNLPPGSEAVGVLMNNTEADLTFGVAAKVDRWDGEDWAPHGWLGMCMDHWHCTAELQPPGDGIAVPHIGLLPTPDSPGPVERFTTAGLESGWYRISQTSNDGTVASGVLQVAQDAASPAPLVPIDDPAISIHPAVMSTGGATVTLHPLIPAPSGSRSIGDVEAAVEGLGETADVERWDGDRWIHVAEIPLEPPEPEQSSVGRSAILPERLDPGAYRLVRTGPAEPHTGNFWIQP